MKDGKQLSDQVKSLIKKKFNNNKEFLLRVLQELEKLNFQERNPKKRVKFDPKDLSKLLKGKLQFPGAKSYKWAVDMALEESVYLDETKRLTSESVAGKITIGVKLSDVGISCDEVVDCKDQWQVCIRDRSGRFLIEMVLSEKDKEFLRTAKKLKMNIGVEE